MEISLAVTDRCNSRCKMCSIWKKEPKDFLIKNLNNLPKSIDKINLSGGEPILNPELFNLVASLSKKHPNIRVILLSNGLNPELLIKKIRQLSRLPIRLGVAISLDGLERNLVRGINYSHRNQQQSVLAVKEEGLKDLRISYLVTKYNYNQFLSVYNFARKNKVDFSWNIVRNSNFFYQKNDNKIPISLVDKINNEIELVVKKQLSPVSLKSWLRGYVSWAQLKHFQTGLRDLSCLAGQKHFYVDVNGVVFPCNWFDFEMGSLAQKSFAQILAENGQEVKGKVLKCNKCWGCGLKSELSSNKLKVVRRIGQLKINNLV